MRVLYTLTAPTFPVAERTKPADKPAAPRVRAQREPREQRKPVDFDSVPGHQWAMHERLLNWARASRDIPMSITTKSAPGFDLYRSDNWQREYGAETLTVVDQRDAAKVAVGVIKLGEPDNQGGPSDPKNHRAAIQWYYLRRCKGAGGFARQMNLTAQELADVVREARQALIDGGV